MTELTISSNAPGERIFVLGNEAIARGAIEAGVQVAAAYPGTPSSEILETLVKVAKEFDIYVEWSVNEKVALETALAASICGVRSMASMKHVGLNVAHDSLMTAGYIGAKGGFVLVVADDPWAWSSQNEQDNRFIALQGYFPVLEPSSAQEAKDMVVDAFKLSEEFRQLFMIRSVTRIGHSRSDIVLGNILRERRKGAFIKDREWLVYTPAGARRNRPLMIERFEAVRKAVDKLKYNQLNLRDKAKLGILACGVPYNYVLEAVKSLGIEEQVSILKIGTPHPLPKELVISLLKSVGEILVVEELEPFIELHTKAVAGEYNLPVKIHGKDLLPIIGELSTRIVTVAISLLMKLKLPDEYSDIDKLEKEVASFLPWRPPTLCPGCPHRASLYAVTTAAQRVAREYGKDVEPVYPGDIGCYSLGVNPPLEALDVQVCMGGSFGLANGLAHVIDAPIVTQMGDSTFFHSGIAPMINAVYNKANITMVILDNSATAMTGFQPHPGTGYTASNEKTVEIKPENVARACGIEFVEVIDPFDIKNSIAMLMEAIRFKGPAVIVSRRLCAIIDQREKRKTKEKIVPCSVDQTKCNIKCSTCIKLLGCPAIIRQDGRTLIDSILCVGCGVCAQICPYKAIIQE